MTKNLDELLPELKTSTGSRYYDEQHDAYNWGVKDCKKKLSQAFKDGVICWCPSEESLEVFINDFIEKERPLKLNWIHNLTQAILERIKGND